MVQHPPDAAGKASGGALVAVWHLDGDLPAGFLGYATLAEDRVVLLHPSDVAGAPVATRATRATRATGATGATSRPEPDAGDLARVRTRIGQGTTLEVIDGRLVAGISLDGVQLSMVYLDHGSSVPPVELPWPRQDHDAEARQAFLSRLAQLGEDDPKPPARPGPPQADPTPPGPWPIPPRSWRPPWCLLFPRCPGCS